MPAGAHRLTAWLLALAYMLAATGSGLFHDHEHGLETIASRGHLDDDTGNLCRDADHACCHEAHGHEPEAQPVAQSHSSHAGGHSHHHAPGPDDGCSVCRFLGQNSAPVAPPVALVGSETVTDVFVLAAPQGVTPVVGIARSRAPPSLV